MITPVFASRRAERFAQLLDEAAGARRHHSRTGDESGLDGMVALGHRVTTLPLVVEVDPEFRTGLRASLMARIDREGIGATATEPEADTPSRRRIGDLLPSGRTRSAIIATIAAGSFGAFGVSAASGDAIPGDTLYGVKRSAEQAQLALAGSDVSRGQLNLEFARKRLAEAGAVGSDVNKLDPVLDDMDTGMLDGSRLLTMAAVERGDAAGLQAVQAFAKDQRPLVAGLVGRLNGPAKGRAAESLALLDRINERSDGLQQTVKCAGIEVPFDELGAVPVACAKAAPPPQQQNPAGGAPEATKVPTAGPNAGATGGPAGSGTGNGTDADATTPTPTAGTPSSPGAAVAGSGSDESEDDGIVDSIKKALEGIFG